MVSQLGGVSLLRTRSRGCITSEWRIRYVDVTHGSRADGCCHDLPAYAASLGGRAHGKSQLRRSAIPRTCRPLERNRAGDSVAGRDQLKIRRRNLDNWASDFYLFCCFCDQSCRLRLGYLARYYRREGGIILAYRQHIILRYALVALSLFQAHHDQATAREVTSLVGQNGWDLERFGNEATILRTRRVASNAANRGGLLLSCAGSFRRLRLTLPDGLVPESRGPTAGLLLMRSGSQTSVARVTVNNNILTLVDQRMIDMVLLQLRESVAASRTLSLLLNLGSNPIMLGRSTAFHLSLASAARDEPAFRDATEACGGDIRCAAPMTPR